MKKAKQLLISYVWITVGSFIYALGFDWCYVPNDIGFGGMTGLAQIVNAILPWAPIGAVVIVLNIPLFLAAFRLQGVKPVVKTLYATAALSFFLGVMPEWIFVKDDLLLTAVFGGALSGAGFGLVLGGDATTGGTDLLAALLRRWMPQYSVAEIMMVLDGMIVLAGAAVFGVHYALYAIIAVFIVGKVSDAMVEGWKFAKQAYIISEKYEEIAARLMAELDRGVTNIYAKGMYSEQDRPILFCVVSRKEIVRLKQIAAQTDPRAFVIVSDAREVLGEGFMELSQ